MNKKISVILGAIIILIAIGEVVWVATNQQDQPAPAELPKQEVIQQEQPVANEQEEQPSNQEAVSEETQPTIDTSDWQTYRDEGKGFEFKYPSHLGTIVLSDVYEGGSEGYPSFKFNYGGHFAMGVWNNSEKKSPKELLDEAYGEYSGGWFGSFEKIGDNPEKYRAVNKDACYIEYDLVPQKDTIVRFRFELCSEDNRFLKQTFHTIIDSFHFTK